MKIRRSILITENNLKEFIQGVNQLHLYNTGVGLKERFNKYESNKKSNKNQMKTESNSQCIKLHN